MATVGRNPKSWSYSDLANLNYYIGQLRSNINPGQIIYQSYMQTLINLVNAAAGHYHTYDDLYQTASYGNNGDRATYIRDTNTGAAWGLPAQATAYSVAAVTTTTTITASTHNQLAQNIRIYGYHNHSIDDRTG